MGLKGNASWVKGHSHMEVLGEGVGTIWALFDYGEGVFEFRWEKKRVKEKDKHSMAAINTMKAATIGKSLVVYVNEIRQATLNVDASEGGLPLVANYVRNTLGKYELVKSMLNSSTGFFFFQFISMEGLDSMLQNGPWFIRNNPLILKKLNPDVNLMKEDVGNVSVWVKLQGVPMTTSSYARALVEIQAYMKLKDTIVEAMPKLVGEDECPKSIGSGVAKNLKNPSQAPKEPTKKVSNSISFVVLNSVKNDVDLGTNGGTSYLASKKANSSGSSFWNVGSSSTSNTPVVGQIDKIEKLIIDGKLTLVDDEGKSLKKVDALVDHDSDDEVASVDNEMTSFMASKKYGYGTNSLLEQ
nr:hypothetical protein [Tanacetum cinerariifolium]